VLELYFQNAATGLRTVAGKENLRTEPRSKTIPSGHRETGMQIWNVSCTVYARYRTWHWYLVPCHCTVVKL